MVKSLKRTLKDSKINELDYEEKEKIIKHIVNDVLNLINEHVETVKSDKSLEWNTGYTHALCDISKIITKEYYDNT